MNVSLCMNQLIITAYSLDYEVIYSIVGKKRAGVEQKVLDQWECFEVHEGKLCIHTSIIIPTWLKFWSNVTVVICQKQLTIYMYVHEFLALSLSYVQHMCPTGSSQGVWKDWQPDNKHLLHNTGRPWYPPDFQTTHHPSRCLLCALRWTGLFVLWRGLQFCLNYPNLALLRI